MSESELISDLRDRNPDAFRRLCDLHMSSLWRFVCWRVQGDQHLAEDIVNETLLTLIVSVDTLHPEGIQFGRLVTRGGQQQSSGLPAARARVWRLVQDVSRNEEARSGPQSREAIEKVERVERVWKILSDMPDQHRLALEWKYLDRLSVRDMADRWSTTEKAVESILFRARNEFRERYEVEEGSSEPPLPARCDKNPMPLASTGQQRGRDNNTSS